MRIASKSSFHTPALLALVGFLTGCGPEEVPPLEGPPQICSQADYDAAVRDAESPTANDVSTSLWAITPNNNRLVWNADRTQVLMVQWTGFTGYQIGDNVLARDIFVTAAPQVKEFCRGYAPEHQPMRLLQYLGLPLEGDRVNSRRFVEMWVTPPSMFRPCADPEIDDSTCGLQFPSGASQQHKDWMNDYFAGSYAPWQGTKYPWTALGYTYDWCSTTTVMGASEFVVRAGSTVTVRAVTATKDYCVP